MLKGLPPTATFLFRQSAADSWRRLPTNLVGADVYMALAEGEGDYALTLDAPGPSISAAVPHRQRGSGTVWVTLVTSLVLVQLGVILIARLLRARAAP
jgi:hypothetical protein